MPVSIAQKVREEPAGHPYTAYDNEAVYPKHLFPGTSEGKAPAE